MGLLCPFTRFWTLSVADLVREMRNELSNKWTFYRYTHHCVNIRSFEWNVVNSFCVLDAFGKSSNNIKLNASEFIFGESNTALKM